MTGRGINADDFYEQQEKNAFFVPNVHYKVPKKVDPVRISQTVKKNLLKDNGNYQKEVPSDNAEVSLGSKDQEVNFGNRGEDDDDVDVKGNIEKEKDVEDGSEEAREDKLKIEEEKDFFKPSQKENVNGK